MPASRLDQIGSYTTPTTRWEHSQAHPKSANNGHLKTNGAKPRAFFDEWITGVTRGVNTKKYFGTQTISVDSVKAG
jgi:hypothetical protein